MLDKSRIISLIDLTSLNDADDAHVIETLCKKAMTPFGKVAAVCLFSPFVKLAKALVAGEHIPVATVANFPSGKTDLKATLTEIELALADGADEIDVVMPYQDYLAGNKKSTQLLVRSCKQLCNDKTLKVILETGALSEDTIIYDASCRILEAGADFIKTSTGKIAVGATIEAATQMLHAIRQVNPDAGFKASGGIRTPEQAQVYIDLAREIMGETWCNASHLRIGASSLLDVLIKE
ncbi:MAG: deoxyribose-phosphate aldolase [Gammaproteobacteria bacterium]